MGSQPPAKLTFGTHTICPRCRKRDKRGNLYGRGWYYWPSHSLRAGDNVIKYEGDWARVKCQVCNGRGYTDGKK